mmetsp:Transcript_17488/g.33790  ORF Transcript_17488/g.33790 Transcript_17488/m.33790 type:complete len:450 (+) Transcript_17488:1064-2413(+)
MGMPTGTGAGAGGAEGGGAGGGGGAAGLGTLKDGVNSFALTLRVKGLALGLSVNFLAGAAGLAASAGFSALLAGADAGEDVGGGAGVGAARALDAAASSPSAGLLEPCPPMCMRTRIGSGRATASWSLAPSAPPLLADSTCEGVGAPSSPNVSALRRSNVGPPCVPRITVENLSSSSPSSCPGAWLRSSFRWGLDVCIASISRAMRSASSSEMPGASGPFFRAVVYKFSSNELCTPNISRFAPNWSHPPAPPPPFPREPRPACPPPTSSRLRDTPAGAAAPFAVSPVSPASGAHATSSRPTSPAILVRPMPASVSSSPPWPLAPAAAASSTSPASFAITCTNSLAGITTALIGGPRGRKGRPLTSPASNGGGTAAAPPFAAAADAPSCTRYAICRTIATSRSTCAVWNTPWYTVPFLSCTSTWWPIRLWNANSSRSCCPPPPPLASLDG